MESQIRSMMHLQKEEQNNYKAASNNPCVTISLDFKFISATKKGDEIIGFAKILKKTKNMVFLICHLKSKEKIIASASGVWKILNTKS